jgi:hypothetical protein
LVFASDSFFYIRRALIFVLAAQYPAPTIFDVPEHVDSGGLMRNGSSFSGPLQPAGHYTTHYSKVKGADP